MEKERINEFMTFAESQMQGIISFQHISSVSVYPEYGLIKFSIDGNPTIEEAMDIIEDNAGMTVLYHKTISPESGSGHTCCAFSDISKGMMFKINVKADIGETVTSVIATVYDSADVMHDALVDELQAEQGSGKMLHICDTKIIDDKFFCEEKMD